MSCIEEIEDARLMARIPFPALGWVPTLSDPAREEVVETEELSTGDIARGLACEDPAQLPLPLPPDPTPKFPKNAGLSEIGNELV